MALSKSNDTLSLISNIEESFNVEPASANSDKSTEVTSNAIKEKSKPTNNATFSSNSPTHQNVDEIPVVNIETVNSPHTSSTIVNMPTGNPNYESNNVSFMSKLTLPGNYGDNDNRDASLPDASSSLGLVANASADNTGLDNSTQSNGFAISQSTPEAIWQMNYHEAAIFLQEGEDNDKFDSHPSQRSALPAYLLTHSPWFYGLDLLASLFLMSLSVAEKPAIDILQGVNEGVHATVELLTLSVLGISIVMQLKWLGWRKFVKHKRSSMKIFAWLIMFAEAITVIVRNTSHFRVTRALRPIFLLDNRYLGGVRRFLRQLLQSVPPILEVVAILLLVLSVFTTLAYYLFSTHAEDPYFTTLSQSFVSLFVLLTTANFPDVMMPSYARNKWSAAFFILYLAITLYCIMNFMMAIVFVVFSSIEKDKFRKLLLHKRKACQLAFRLLVSRNSPKAITYDNFTGLLKYFKPKAKDRDVYLIFKALNKSNTGSLSLDEFYQVYTACNLKWRPTEPEAPWFSHLPFPGPRIGTFIRKIVISPVFEGFVYVIICCNAVTLLVHTILLSVSGGVTIHPHITWDQLAYIAFYSTEVVLKVIGLGLTGYFSSGWNIFDFLVTLLSIAGVCAEAFGRSFFFIVILRPLRLLRLFRIRRRYREVFETLTLLAPRVFSASVVIIVIYYFFAIIGMEVFSVYDLKNCCINSTVEQYYHSDNTSIYQNYYYLNNFDNIFMAGVTLFELTVVNNWFIIMEGYAYVSGGISRLYFMIFYLVMMVVMSVVLAFILEAFTFRMQYNQTVNKDRRKPRCEVTKVVIPLTCQEVDFVYRDAKDNATLLQYAHDRTRGQESDGLVHYIGVGPRSKTALQLRMYRHLLHSWLKDANMLHSNRATPQHTRPEAQQEHETRRNRVLEEAERDEDAPGPSRRRTASRVTLGGVTEVVEQQEGDTWTVRKRGIASNLLEWWKAETEDFDEEDEINGMVGENKQVQSQVIWGLDEEEVNTSSQGFENPMGAIPASPFDNPEERSSHMTPSASMPVVNYPADTQPTPARDGSFPTSFSSDPVVGETR